MSKALELATLVTGDFVTNTDLTDAIDGIPEAGTNTPAFRAYSSVDQTEAAQSLERVVLDTTDYDTDSAFANNVFTVPAGAAGKYLLYGSLQSASSTDFDDYQVQIVKNTSDTLAIGRMRHFYADNAQVTTVADLAEGDTIELKFYNGRNTGDTILFASSDGTFFGGFKLI